MRINLLGSSHIADDNECGYGQTGEEERAENGDEDDDEVAAGGLLQLDDDGGGVVVGVDDAYRNGVAVVQAVLVL
jgi:hypothetical protein